MNIDNLRPWEYDEMEADDYEMILHLQSVFRQEMQTATEAVERLNARKKKAQ